ncbi:hypothetical protein [Pararhizobium arenae]|uniref:hypothetical protein n=1 Tax=Pararhizobium arenae TaxID=1856850 RepID=UPI00094A9EAA|nr:hypothetical protein [Pararhizobium arenae]
MTDALNAQTAIHLAPYIVTRPDEKGTIYHAESARHTIDQCCIDAGFEGAVNAALQYGFKSVELFIRTIKVQPLKPLAERIAIVDPIFEEDDGLCVLFSISVDGHIVHYTLEWLDENYDLVRQDDHLTYGDANWPRVVADAAMFGGMDFDDVKVDVRDVVLTKLALAVAQLKALAAYNDAIKKLASAAGEDDPSKLTQVNRLVGQAFSCATKFEEQHGAVIRWKDDVDRLLAGTCFICRHNDGDDTVSVGLATAS